MTDDMSRTTYRCTRCGACCRWPGIVRVSAPEIDALADYLGMPVEEFLSRYTRLADDRRGLILTDNAKGYCIFLGDDDRCLVNPVKPRQCLDFPEFWNFPGFEKFCNAVRTIPETDPEGHSLQE